mmetsp:Transcript_27315/g.54657  ORF Transcript_27315/g.54657 Transcript_27315/m.54657 type:complete len:252 (+) Transcript_27315:204-959(+)
MGTDIETSFASSFEEQIEVFEKTATTKRRSIVWNWVLLHLAFVVLSVMTYVIAANYIHLHPFDVSSARGSSYYYGNDNNNYNTYNSGTLKAQFWSGPMTLAAFWMVLNMSIFFVFGMWVMVRKNEKKFLALFFGALVMMGSTCLLITLIFGIFTVRDFFVWNANYESESQMASWGKNNHNIRLASLAFGRLYFIIAALYFYFAFVVYYSREDLMEEPNNEMYQNNEGSYLQDNIPAVQRAHSEVSFKKGLV